MRCDDDRAGGRPSWARWAVVAVAVALSTSGCIVRKYQPLGGLHRPVVVDATLANFPDLDLTVHCVPKDLLKGAQAGALCQKVAVLFENQGATVTTIDSVGRFEEGFEERPPDAADTGPREDLIVELRAWETHHSNRPLSWVAFVFSFTLVPAVYEQSFAQQVVVRDGSGFLLVSDRLEGRVVRRFGLGNYILTALADLGRPRELRLTTRAADRQLSNDLYTQLTQLVYNAKLHHEVLQAAVPAEAP